MKCLGVLCLLAVWSSIVDGCDKPCECGGIGFEKASPKFSNVLLNVTDGKSHYNYWVSPCSPITCNSTNTGDTSGGAAGCQRVHRDGRDDEYITLGKVNSPSWTPSSSTNFTVCYGDGDPANGVARRACIVFAVTNVTDPIIAFVAQEANTLDYYFAVQLPKGEASSGVKAGSPVGIAGLVIMFLLLLGVVAYFVIGALVMYHVKGARGAEVIPNYEFWKGLPLLIKDGFMFTISPCRKKFGSGYEAL